MIERKEIILYVYGNLVFDRRGIVKWIDYLFWIDYLINGYGRIENWDKVICIFFIVLLYMYMI